MIRKRTFLCVFPLIALVSVPAWVPAEEITHTKETLEKVLDRIDEKDAILLDVRSPEEWDEAHVEGAIHLPIDEITEAMKTEKGRDEIKARVEKILKAANGKKNGQAGKPASDAPTSEASPSDGDDAGRKLAIYCHCRAGGRALRAAKILHELGFDARGLKPGIEDLLEAGYPRAEPMEDAAGSK